jgi:hypothetical protein
MDRIVSKQEAQEIAAELKAAAEEILLRHGYDMSMPRTKYGNVFEWKITASPVEAGPNGVNLNSPEAQAFNMYASLYGMDLGLLGGTLDHKGETLTFIGVVPSRRKYPLAFRKADGSTILMTEMAGKLVKAPEQGDADA